MFTTMHKFRPPNKVLTFLCPAASSALADHHPFPSWVSDNRLIQRHPRLLCLEARLSLRRLRAILAFAIVSGLFRIPFVSSRLLLHASSFDLDFAFVIFQRMRSPNRFSWNTIIRAASVCENQQTSVAFSLYAEMLLRGNLPDKYTFPFLLKACRSRSDLNYGSLLHCHALTLGLSDDIYLQTALVTMYLSCGQLDLARYVFDDIPQKDVVVWTTVISGLVENGCHEEALKVFNQMSRQIEVQSLFCDESNVKCFVKHCCPWLLPPLLLSGDNARLNWISKMKILTWSFVEILYVMCLKQDMGRGTSV